MPTKRDRPPHPGDGVTPLPVAHGALALLCQADPYIEAKSRAGLRRTALGPERVLASAITSPAPEAQLEPGDIDLRLFAAVSADDVLQVEGALAAGRTGDSDRGPDGVAGPPGRAGRRGRHGVGGTPPSCSANAVSATPSGSETVAAA